MRNLQGYPPQDEKNQFDRRYTRAIRALALVGRETRPEEAAENGARVSVRDGELWALLSAREQQARLITCGNY